MERRRCMGCMQLITGKFCPHCGWEESGQNAAHQLPPGTRLQGQYILGRVLGQGGFGITYLGWDTLLERTVAIKEFYPSAVVSRNAEEDPTVRVNTQDMEVHFTYSRERFLREARALAALTDIPEIVGIHGTFSENNTAYIVMEYVKGTELQHYVSRKGGKLSFDETMEILGPVIFALEQVHRAGLVHRDISPDNIMLHSGGAKLLDFGAVRAVENPDVEKDLEKSTEAVVKQGFAPMEQYRSRGNIGPWSDVYALCATIYYCLTGKVPPDALARFMDEEQISWQEIPGLTDRQRAALEKGMAVLAKDRYASASEFIKALREKTTEPAKAAQKSRPRRKWLPGVIAAVLAAALGIGTLVLLPEKEAAGPEVPETAQQLQLAPTTQEPSTLPETEPETLTAPTEPQTEPPTTLPPETEPQEPWEKNLLKYYPLNDLTTDITKITRVTFLDTLAKVPEDAVDLSYYGDGSVLGWIDHNQVTIAAEGGINAGDSCMGLFAGCYELNVIIFGTAFHTEHTTTMAEMFNECYHLTSVDVQYLDTGNVTDMRGMFSMGHRNMDTYDHTEDRFGWIESLDVKNWDVSKVRDMSYMFQNCRNLKKLDVTFWNTGSVENTERMFFRCERLHELNVGTWDMSRVTTMKEMFRSTGLYALNVADWDVSNVENFEMMFSYSSELFTLDVSRWDVSSATTMEGMFRECTMIPSFDLTGWDVSNVTTMYYMFYGCSRIQKMDMSTWDVSSVKTFEYTFGNCIDLKEVNVTGWDLASATTMKGMFSRCNQLKVIDVSSWDIRAVRDMSYMFWECYHLLTLDTSAWDTKDLIYWNYFMHDGGKINGRPWRESFRF